MKTIYVMIGPAHSCPLGVYRSLEDANTSDEFNRYVDGYNFIRSSQSPIDETTWYKFEQDEQTEFGPVTNRKTITIYAMKLKDRKAEHASTDNL